MVDIHNEERVTQNLNVRITQWVIYLVVLLGIIFVLWSFFS